MYIIKRNKIVIEDLGSNSELFGNYDAGVIAEQPMLAKFNTLYSVACINSITKAIGVVLSRLNLIPEKDRPPLTYDMVREELNKPEYLEAGNVTISKFNSYIEYNKYKCDLSCGKFDFELDFDQLPSLTDAQIAELDLPNLLLYINTFITYFDEQPEGVIDTAIEDMKYYTFARAVYDMFDFSVLLPSTIEYSGFHAIGDGGEGVFDRLADVIPSNVGIFITLKRMTYKRRFTQYVKAAWFGAGSNTVINQETFEAMLAYSYIEFSTGVVNIAIKTPITKTLTSNFEMFGKDTIINIQALQPIEYFVFFDATENHLVDISGFRFNVFDTSAPFRTVFEFAPAIMFDNVLYKNTYNCNQEGHKLMQTHKDYTVGPLEFNKLPLLTPDVQNANALATLGTVPIDTDTSDLMTINTEQIVSGGHTYETIDILGPTSAATAMPYSKLPSLKTNVINALRDKIVALANSAKFKPPVNFIFIQYPNQNGLLSPDDEPSVIWENTTWQLLHKRPLLLLAQVPDTASLGEQGYVKLPSSTGAGPTTIEVNIWRRTS